MWSNVVLFSYRTRCFFLLAIARSLLVADHCQNTASFMEEITLSVESISSHLYPKYGVVCLKKVHNLGWHDLWVMFSLLTRPSHSPENKNTAVALLLLLFFFFFFERQVSVSAMNRKVSRCHGN